jgi:hypothetical protein
MEGCTIESANHQDDAEIGGTLKYANMSLTSLV